MSAHVSIQLQAFPSFLLERQEMARKERVEGKADRKELIERGKRCTVTEESLEVWKAELVAYACTEKKSK